MCRTLPGLVNYALHDPGQRGSQWSQLSPWRRGPVVTERPFAFSGSRLSERRSVLTAHPAGGNTRSPAFTQEAPEQTVGEIN